MEVPGTPAGLVVLADGRALVSLPGVAGSSLALLGAGPQWRLEEVLDLDDGWVPRGIALAAGGERPVVAAGPGLLVVDPAAFASAGTGIVASIPLPGARLMQVALDRAGRFAFATDEDRGTLVGFDFATSLATPAPAAKLVGERALPPGPVGIALSPDGAHVLVTSQHAARGRRDGVLSVVAVEAMLADPGRAHTHSVAAGCQPVRLAIAPDGVVWVTARASNSLLGFDLARLLAGRRGALRTVVRVGAAPVGLDVTRAGTRVVVANSNRYEGAEEPQTLAVVDAVAALADRPALLGHVGAGVFPREIAALPDDRTVLVANFTSRTVQVVTLPG